MRSETAVRIPSEPMIRVPMANELVDSDRAVGMDPTTPDTACFEAGIKFGSLYHQFAGTPVSPDSSASLARAMEESIENQPFCTDVTVEIRDDELEAALAAQSAEYTELTGRFMDVEIVIDYEGATVVASMAMDGDYPRMQLDRVERP
jgi:hypothetical protein